MVGWLPDAVQFVPVAGSTPRVEQTAAEVLVILVVGGTGELGSAVVRILQARGQDVAVMVRPSTAVGPAGLYCARLVRGDLADPASLRGVCEGMDAVIATANSIVPRRGERVRAGALVAGYAELARQARLSGVRRFVFVSVPKSVMGHGAAEFDEKRRVEDALHRYGAPLTVVRPSLFMQSWLPAVGSRLALEGAERPTLDRGFWLTRLVGATMHRSLDRFGLAVVPGDGSTRHSFVDLDDVGEAVAATLDLAEGSHELEIGGRAMSWRDVAAVHAHVLGLPLRVLRAPTGPMRLGGRAMRPFSPAGANLLIAQDLLARVNTTCPTDTATRLLGRPPTSVQQFLTEKLATRAARVGAQEGVQA